MNVSKIVLGTVQFGTQYGINSVGRPDLNMVQSILETAHSCGIVKLDTSAAYGNSEDILGQSIKDKSAFQIISKYPKCGMSVFEAFNQTLKYLQVNTLYGYLLHHFSIYKENPSVWNAFINLKRKGLVDKIGFSLYSPEELDLILNNNIEFDLVQFPYNVFDRQFEPYFEPLKDRGVEIHVRSTFLQGLFFKDRNALPAKLLPLKKYLQKLDQYSVENNISISELALNYNLQNQYIDGVLIGVDNVEQLKINLSSILKERIELDINVKEKDLLNPVNWQ